MMDVFDIAAKIALFYPQSTPYDMEKNVRLARAILRMMESNARPSNAIGVIVAGTVAAPRCARCNDTGVRRVNRRYARYAPCAWCQR